MGDVDGVAAVGLRGPQGAEAPLPEAPLEHGLLALLVGYFVGLDLGVEGFYFRFSASNFGLLRQAILLDGVELPGLEARKQLNSSQT